MAPAPETSAATPGVTLPETVSVLPLPSAAYATTMALLPENSTPASDPAPGIEAEPPIPVVATAQGGPVTAPKQSRLVEPLIKSAPQPDIASTAAPAPEMVALAEDSAPRKNLAQKAISLVSFIKPDGPQGDVDRLIVKYAEFYEVPVALVRRVVKRESNFRPSATNRGHYGLMQIKPATARSMGYSGPAQGLLDAETNLKYAVKYLRGAFLVAEGNHDRADRLYQSGYYYHAKRQGLLDETGLGKDRRRRSG